MLLTQDQEMIRDAVRDFAQEQLWPHAARWDKEHHFPKEAHQGLAAAGLFRFSDIEFLGMKLTASFQAAVIGLAIHEGAYMAEIVRNGVQAVARGQVEAAKSLGMSSWQVTWRIVIPQATRVINYRTGK